MPSDFLFRFRPLFGRKSADVELKDETKPHFEGGATKHVRTPFAIAILGFLIAAVALGAVHTMWPGQRTNAKVHSSEPLLGYPNLSATDLADIQHYGITADFARGINAAGLGAASIQQLLALQQYGVDRQHAASMARVRLRGLGFDDLVHLHQYDVTAEYAARMHAMGYADVQQVIELQQEGITVEQLESLQRAGGRGLSVDQVVANIHPQSEPK